MFRKFSQSKNTGPFLIVIASLLSVLVGVGIGSGIQHFYSISQTAHAANYPAVTAQGVPDFVSLVKKVGPAVVNISTTQVRKTAQDVPAPFGGEDPSNEFWKRFFGGQIPRGPQRQRGLGSGFIIDRDGTILTNYHVVDGAEKTVVTLSDGRSFDAKVLGRDQKTDIAIVKINAPQDLPVVTFGDSDRLEVGEWVLAIGDPFGLDHTVTSGIVSAKGRQIGAGPYDNFIQTDASINPGNSGGPLLNMRGEVVGINTAIFSQSGGNIGIGFAIPTNLVKGVLPQLKNKGKVVRGYLGTVIQSVTPEVADNLGLDRAEGVVVTSVKPGSPAEEAGLQRGDVITQVNRSPVRRVADYNREVGKTGKGKSLLLLVKRGDGSLFLALKR